MTFQTHDAWMAFRMGLVAVVAIGLTLTVLMQCAKAHDHWINDARLVDPFTKEWCCNEHDCELINAGGVSETSGDSYLISETGEIFPAMRVIWKSGDGRWWRCRYLGGDKAGQTRCLIGPVPNS
jgi:hypothetical protein